MKDDGTCCLGLKAGRRGQVLIFLAALTMLICTSTLSWSLQPPRTAITPLAGKVRQIPELQVSASHEPLAKAKTGLSGIQRTALDDFRVKHGQDFQVHIDPRSGTPSNILGRIPIIPGAGKGNHLTRKQLSTQLGEAVDTIDTATVGKLARQFIIDSKEALNLDTAQLGDVTANQVQEQIWQITAQQQVAGIKVRGARISATISRGNLVMIGTEKWGKVKISAKPAISAEKALELGFLYADGQQATDKVLTQPALEIVPTAPLHLQRGDLYVGPSGQGYEHRLVWTFSFSRPPATARWEVMIDAQTGEVVSFQDLNQYLASVTGGVYPLSNTEICPSPDRCGTMLPDQPMPFADTGLAAPHNFTNGAGQVNYSSGNILTTLFGKYLRVEDMCGPTSETAAGSIQLGGSNGQHDCDAAGTSPGNTAASRTVFYEVNKIQELARGYLPGNSWLQGTLNAYPNRDSTCNAYWNDGDNSVNFYQSGGGCRNTGEIAAILDHEWAHGLDYHDGNGYSNPSEAYADIAAIYRLQSSCIGHGFFQTLDQGCGMTADGSGFNSNESQTTENHCAVDCSGVRDADWDKHADHTPDTPANFVCTKCVADAYGYNGPCGRQAHCESAVDRQAAWDLAARDLQSSPFNYDTNTAFLIASRLFYQSSGSIGAWHACSCAGAASNGCGANNAYMQWLVADDDDGDLTNGTPHMTAIYNAFNRHGIACATPTPINSGCDGAPAAAPVMTVVSGNNQVAVSWLEEPAAAKYKLFRSEGSAGCNLGKTLIATVTGATQHTDTDLANGRQYCYSVMAVGASDACFSPASSCICAVPELGPHGTLRGAVKDLTTNSPISGATITLAGFPDQVTDSTGGYQLASIPVGDYEIAVAAYGYQPQVAIPIQIGDGAVTTKNVDLVPFTLGTIQGTVTDSSGHGWPLYATITVTAPGLSQTLQTNPATGQYGIALVPGVQHTFTVSADNYVAVTRTITPAAGGTVENFTLSVDGATCKAAGYSDNYSSYLYTETFESSDGGYTASPTVPWESTTWAWGVPVSGPGNAHSGTHVWGNNLPGLDAEYEDGYVTSPTIDLSANAGQSSFLSWWHWLTDQYFWDNSGSTVEVSNDGGTTWTEVYRPTGVGTATWTRASVLLGSQYSVSNFRVRYRFKLTPEPGLYIDDITVAPATCTPLTGGLLVGTVLNGTTSAGINDALISDGASHETLSVATPTDLVLNDGFYRLFLPPGPTNITVSRTGFGNESAAINVSANAITSRDITLTPAPLTIVQGTVKDDSGHGWPLYAKIELSAPNYLKTIYTDPVTGSYSVALFGNTTFTFKVSSADYTLAEREVYTATGSLVEDFMLPVAYCTAKGYGDPGAGGLAFFDTVEGSNEWTASNTTWNRVVPINGPLTARSGNHLFGPVQDSNRNYTAGYLTSPRIDLSATAGQTPTVSWWHWYRVESTIYKTDVEVSKDDGITWDRVYQLNPGNLAETEWTRHAVQLDPSYAVSSFRVRFYYYGATDLSLGWYLDDIAIQARNDCPPIPGGLFIGNVYGANQGGPLNNATLNDGEGRTVTTVATPDDPALDDGFYTLFLPAGNRVLTATHGDTGASQLLQVTTDSLTRQNFTLVKNGILQGTVLLAATGAPLSGATVTVERIGSTTTDSSGQYLFGSLPVGTYTVTVSHYGFSSATIAELVIESDVTTTQDFSVTALAVATLQGSVTDGSGHGWPLTARIAVSAPGHAATIHTDPLTGNYSANLYLDTPYTLTTSATGYQSATQTLTLASGGSTNNVSLTVDNAACQAPGYGVQDIGGEQFEASDGGFTVSGTNASWVWGVPTSGPGAAHSGSRVWATSLVSGYNNDEDSYLTSPLMDLSAHTGQAALLVWWQWLTSEINYDFARVEVSNDGGNTWSKIYGPVSGSTDVTWTRHAVQLDPAYSVATFRVRFRMLSDDAVTTAGWHIDDISVQAQSSCQLLPGGIVAGNVTAADTGSSLNNALVTDLAGHTAYSAATPDLPTVADGFYALFLPPGVTTLVASHSDYGGEQPLTVVTDQITRQDLSLATCSISLDPASSSFTAAGGTGSLTVTTGSGCSWTVTSLPGWITLTSGNSGMGNGTVGYAVAAHTDTVPRTGTFSIKSQSFSVNQASNYGIVRGYVRSAVGGNPISGAKVTAGGQEVYTNASGFYTVSSLLSGSYDGVTAGAYGYYAQSVSGIVITHDGITNQDFTLSATPVVTVSGTVADGSGHGWPLYASITVTAPGFTSTFYTDPVTGQFTRNLFQDTLYTVTINAAGYTAATREISATANGLNENFALSADPVSCNALGYSGVYHSQSFEANNGGYASSGTSSSWAWGIPTTKGPATAHSGARLWATNLTGYYNYNESSKLTSPAIDMSGNAGQPLVLSWWQWTSLERYNDSASVEVSKNGGQNWTQVYAFDEVASTGAWTKYAVELDQSYAASNFQVRFNLWTDNLFVSPGLYVDDISLSPASCKPIPGGLVIGNVYDAVTSVPYNGATVTSRSGSMVATTATPNDPAVSDGFYSIFLPTGKSTVTVTYPGYAVYPTEITQVADSVTRRDFLLLPAGSLQGTVTDAAGGVPLAYASVTLSGGYATTTNTVGDYQFPVVVVGVRDLTVSKQGYLSRTISGIDVPVTGTTQNVSLTRLPFNLFAWGFNGAGQLGTGTTTTIASPALIESVADVIAIVAGNSHTLALKSDNTVWSWGSNSSGQLGDGTTTQRLVPAQMNGLQGGTQVAANYLQSLVLKADGTVWRWGAKSYWGSTYDLAPVQVAGIQGVTAIAAGYYHALALKTDGTVWSWGFSNNYGQIGNGSTSVPAGAVQVPGLSNVVAIAAGIEHSIALKGDGTVWSWGLNNNGQLGNGTNVSSYTPVQAADLTNAVAISAKGSHVLALKADGSLWSWGSNAYGQLGDGTNATRLSPGPVPAMSAVATMAAGINSSLAVKTDGTLWEWGAVGSYTGKLNPVQVSSLLGVDAVAGGEYCHFALLPFNISPKTLAEASVGTPYSRLLTAAGGKAPYSWGVPTGALPPGLTFDTATGTIAGTPGEAGSFTFSITSTDSKGTQATQSYTQLVTIPGTLQGTVTAAVTGLPLSGATVTATGGYTTTTDAAGTYQFPVIPRGTFNVTVAAAGKVTQSFTGIIISSDLTTTLDAALDTCAYAVSASSASYSFVAASGSLQITSGLGCTWSVSGQPSWFAITAGSSGTGSGTVAYTVAANGGTALRTATFAIAGQSFTVTQGSNYGVLQGTVTDAVTGNPISGATVTASGLYTATTDSAGVYRFVALVAGTHELKAWAPLKQNQFVSGVVIMADASHTQNFTLSPAPLVAVQGTVTDGSGHGWPLYVKVEITASGYSSTLFTDPVTGQFTTSLYQDNPYMVKVTGAGYTVVTRTVTPPPGGGAELFALTASSCTTPGYSSDIYYAESFDNGNGGFTTIAPTSWAWGTPTSGPGAAHTGSGAWATNLAGYYGQDENGYLVSPVIDLSASAGKSFNFSWWQWYSISYDSFASLEVSNNGGASWNTEYGPVGGAASGGWVRQNVSLSAAYAVPGFRFRLRFSSYRAINLGWYVDDIQVQSDCNLVPGGLVVGTVSDDSVGAGLNNSVISDAAGHVATAAATPNDPGLSDGYYSLFLSAGSVTLTTALPGYMGGQVAVEVVADSVVRQDLTMTKCSYALNPATATFSAAADSGTIQVLVEPPACAWSVAYIPNWLTLTSGSTGFGSGAISYTVAENTGTSLRSATLAIGDQPFSITQGSNFGTLQGTVTASGTPVNGATVTLAGGGSTVTNSSGYYLFSGLAAGSYTITVAAVDRETATVPGIAVSNDQMTTNDVVLIACSYALTPATVSLGYADGSGSFQVTAGPGCSWSVGNKPTWLTFTTGSSGSGSGTVQYNVTANSGTSLRSASLTVASLVHSVVQGSNYGSIRGTVTVDGSGTVLNGVTVTLNGGGYVTTNSYGYYQFTNIATGTYTIKFTLPGWGDVTVSNVVVNSDAVTTVSAGLASCSYTVTPGFASMGYAGSAGSFQVITGAGCNWVVSNIPSWLTITAGSSGSGSGTTSYAAATNTGTSSRTANLTIAGKSFALTQAGTVPLTVAVNPAGSGTVSGGSINCPGSCTAAYDSGASVVLTAVAANGYRFGSWSGCDYPSGNSCSLIMSANRSVTAEFLQSAVQKSGVFYDTLQAACNAAVTGDIILTTLNQLQENILFNQDLRITLSGGYSDDFTTRQGHTVIIGSLTIGAGEVTIENVTIQ